MKSHKSMDLRCAVSKTTPNSDKLCADHPLSFGKLPFVSVWVASDFDAEIWVARKKVWKPLDYMLIINRHVIAQCVMASKYCLPTKISSKTQYSEIIYLWCGSVFRRLSNNLTTFSPLAWTCTVFWIFPGSVLIKGEMQSYSKYKHGDIYWAQIAITYTTMCCNGQHTCNCRFGKRFTLCSIFKCLTE